jgi:hypothetical protein
MIDLPPLPRKRIIGQLVRDGQPEAVIGFDWDDVRAYGEACAGAALEAAAKEAEKWHNESVGHGIARAIRALNPVSSTK